MKEDSKKRTDWAEDRTILANERTFSSWMGTGMGAVGVAIGLKAVFGSFDPTWLAKLVSTMFILIAVLIYWIACHQAKKTLERLNETDAEALPTKNFQVLASVMSIATIGVGIILWML